MKIFAIVFLIVAPMTCRAEAWQVQSQAPAGPQAVFSELVHDAGKVEAGVEITHSFKVKNTGKTDLLIKQVNPSWGCTLTDFTQVVPPGQEGQITLTTKTPILRPVLQTTAWVYTNDPANGLVLLTLKATVNLIVELLPSPSLTMQANRGEVAEGKLMLMNYDASPLKILNLELTNQDFTTELRTLEEGRRYELLVRLPPQKTDGQFVTLLTVHTNKEKLSQIPIAVVATVVARVQASPEQLSFGRINLASIRQNPPNPYVLNQWITIKGQESGFKVTNVETTLPFVQLELNAPAQETSPYSIRVSLIKEKLPKGPFTGMVVVQTNDKGFAELKIPISGDVQ